MTTPVQVDGEPWLQRAGALRLTRAGGAAMLRRSPLDDACGADVAAAFAEVSRRGVCRMRIISSLHD